ncbi:hypothetical protein SERLA73DRAFT_176551 [Serpula lacrymans var. lacrymans S7.3]|uniref:Cytochrome P450 n=1 Tax=Serpula lacrymans var. lacrymans (strain S7.3) TaxID=936435 RepID=F8PN56_SERL3|nr:hypothetical protein SERLA73DRAFT_176551 [Serpula lacrymans var. lacrymans S7.3]
MDNARPWAVVAGASCVYAIASVAYRLLFHPLKKYPGPPLAAVTIYYKGYFDVIKRGGLLEHIKQLHQKYGPVVRIAPNELHFDDTKAFADIYAVGSKFTKEPSFYKCFGQDEASFGLIDVHASRIRREILNPLFSRRAVLKLENVVQEKVNKLVSQLLTYRDAQKSANLFMAFRSTTLDIIASYCLAKDFNALSTEGFMHPFLTSLQTLIPFFWVLRYLPFLIPVLMEPPTWIAQFLDSKSRALFDIRQQASAQIDVFLADPEALENPISRSSLLQEALTLLLAGSDTLGNTLTVGTFRVLNDEVVHAKLVEELQNAWPNKDAIVQFTTLEKLPYLTAVLKETLRFASGVVTPLPRVVGPADTRIGDWHVPAGTIISMSSTMMHNNADVFPEPFKFAPERWLGLDAKDLETYLVPFSKGPRGCLGMNLAWCELYLIFANVFRKLEMEMHDTTVEDFKYNDNFVPVYQGKPLHAAIRERST